MRKHLFARQSATLGALAIRSTRHTGPDSAPLTPMAPSPCSDLTTLAIVVRRRSPVQLSRSSSSAICHALLDSAVEAVAVGAWAVSAAVGCAFMGGFYNEAPWPVGSKAKAKKYLR